MKNQHKFDVALSFASEDGSLLCYVSIATLRPEIMAET